ncbi:MAG: hypothetical protein U0941_15890 [Planctomycetaceae bacterium]
MTKEWERFRPCAQHRISQTMFINPKRSRLSATRKESWFDYYAGYSSAFVQDVLRSLHSVQGPLLDPWNGSGTTTTAAHEHGIDSTGIDINPAMIVVAKAKLLTPGIAESLVPLAKDVAKKARRLELPQLTDEPLEEWFSPASAMRLRAFAEAICTLTTPVTASRTLYQSDSIAHVSDLTAFLLVALFRTTRSFMARFQASNPTWMKSPELASNRLRTSLDTITQSFIHHVSSMAEGIVPVTARANTRIMLAASSKLPLENESVGAVIASPPYCTRIDYAVATKPELAILGCPLGNEFSELRRKMIGGPVVSASDLAQHNQLGRNCLTLLDSIKSHHTKGSANYYYKIFLQYYNSLYSSLCELNRVAMPKADCVLVVQDSYYKDIHVDVSTHISEMATNLGWGLIHRTDHETSLLMARLNPKAQKYRSSAGATESVLWFRKAA